MAQANDIEDVLSSIRRLVSGDPGAGASAAPKSPEAAAALVLEPANRVTEPEDPFQTVQLLDQAGETEAAPAEYNETHPDQGSATDVATPSDVDTPVPEDAFANDAAKRPAANASNRDGPATEFSLQSDEEIVDLAQEERDGRDAAHFLADMDTETAAITFDLADGEGDPLVWPAPGTIPTAPEAYLEDTDYVAASADAIPPATAGTATNQVGSAQEGSTGVAEDAAQGSATPSLAVDHVNPASEEEDDVDLADFGDDHVSDTIPLDDEAFRDLIADIVRQELAGDLGERITRNVRKLVRREIRQLLSSDEFD